MKNYKLIKLISVLLSIPVLMSAISVSVSAKDVWSCAQGETFEFGSYPQAKVDDPELISKLEACEISWKSYGYYIGTGKWYDGKMQSSDFMKYADVQMDGDKYRAVTFSAFRPYCTGLTSESTYQDDNGYETDTVYWFKYEPLLWRMLDENECLAVCESIIDSQAFNNTLYYSEEYYQDTTCTVFANNYEKSSIRQWLNSDFYNTAFTANEKNVIESSVCDNSCWNPSHSELNGAPTNDKVFLLSYNEILNMSYGFSSDRAETDSARHAVATDYAVSQGLNVQTDGSAWWWLRTSGSYSGTSCGVNFDGNASHYYNTNYVLNGIRPAVRLDVKSFVPETNVSAKDMVVYYKNSAVVEAEITEIKDIDYTVKYSSSDEKVAKIDTDGNVTATGRGQALITCTVTDEYGNVTEDTSLVEVEFFWWQWLIYIVLFGWIWY